MKQINLKIPFDKREIKNLNPGDLVYLSGKIYTARDKAHAEIFKLMKSKKNLPFQIKNSLIYYVGPTPPKDGDQIGACGPTTARRMDQWTPQLYDNGLIATIGKGERSQIVIDSIIKNKAIYFCAIGGTGALLKNKVVSSRIIAFKELGPEAIRELVVKDFPLVVGINTEGKKIFK